MAESKNDKFSAGVQELIERLRAEGVGSGREEADRIVAEAKEKARKIVDEARREAEKERADARREAEQTRKGGEEGLRLAARDALLDLKRRLRASFAQEVKLRVEAEMSGEETLRELIRAVAYEALPEEKRGRPLELRLPAESVDFETLREDPDKIGEGALGAFLAETARALLEKGVALKPAGREDAKGITVRLREEDLEVDLTDEAVSELLLGHLLPRFRALIEREESTRNDDKR